MYTLGPFARDVVKRLKDDPQSSIGSPCPIVIADEHHLVLAFYLEFRDSNWDGNSIRVVGPDTQNEPHAIIVFRDPLAHFLGPPNDEAFNGHPLQKRGLTPYGAFEIQNSSWLTNLTKMNRVHPCHKDENLKRYKHFIFSFHDSIFECLAEGYELSTGYGSVRDAAARVLAQMR